MQAVLDLITTTGWRWQFEIGATEQPLQTAACVFARPDGDETAALKVWPEPVDEGRVVADVARWRPPHVRHVRDGDLRLPLPVPSG